MEWMNIALAATAILGPYLTKTGEAAAQKIGEDFYHWIKMRFEKKDDKDIQVGLSQLEKKPDSKSRRDVLAEILTERAEADPDGFGAELQARVQQVVAIKSEVGTLVGQIVAGKVSVVNVMYGDINM
jgi:hypothetical protein